MLDAGPANPLTMNTVSDSTFWINVRQPNRQPNCTHPTPTLTVIIVLTHSPIPAHGEDTAEHGGQPMLLGNWDINYICDLPDNRYCIYNRGFVRRSMDRPMQMSVMHDVTTSWSKSLLFCSWLCTYGMLSWIICSYDIYNMHVLYYSNTCADIPYMHQRKKFFIKDSNIEYYSEPILLFSSAVYDYSNVHTIRILSTVFFF